MLIRNKFRGLPQHGKQTESYQPEYKKLGVTPQVGSAALIQPTSVPRNVRVNSGQNEDLAWLPQQRQETQRDNKIIDNNDEVVVHSVRERTFVNESFNDGANRNTPIAYDDIPDYTKSVAAPVSHEEQSNDGSIEFSDISFGEYVLIFENQILGAGTYDEVTAAIEEILLSDSAGTISPKSLVVLKRMQIMTGVLIKDV